MKTNDSAVFDETVEVQLESDLDVVVARGCPVNTALRRLGVAVPVDGRYAVRVVVAPVKK